LYCINAFKEFKTEKGQDDHYVDQLHNGWFVLGIGHGIHAGEAGKDPDLSPPAVEIKNAS
jgi:hypothetical protein